MKILIVKTSALGDIVQTFPAVELIRNICPNAQIDWVVEKKHRDVLDAYQYIHHVYEIEWKRWKSSLIRSYRSMSDVMRAIRHTYYDCIFDFQGNIKSACITFSARGIDKIGTDYRSAPEWPNACVLNHRYAINVCDPITDQYRSLVAQYFQVTDSYLPNVLPFYVDCNRQVNIDRYLNKGHRTMICIGSAWSNKSLTPLMWIEVLKKCLSIKKTHFFFVWGNEKEHNDVLAISKQFPEYCTCLPKMEVSLWRYVMTQMHAIFTVDSSALHLSATAQVPTWSFFGASQAGVYKPIGSGYYANQGSCPYGQIFVKRCRRLRSCSTGACMDACMSNFNKDSKRFYDFYINT